MGFTGACRLQGACGKTMSHVLDGAGHWVHMDQPQQLRSILVKDARTV